MESASHLMTPFSQLCGRNFPPLRGGKGYNSDLKEKSVAYAKSPSDFPIFTQIFFARGQSQNCGLPQFCSFQLGSENFFKSRCYIQFLDYFLSFRKRNKREGLSPSDS